MSCPDTLPEPPRRDPMGRPGERRGSGPARPREPDGWPIHRLLSIAARLDERWINRHLTQLGLTKSALDVLEAVAELEPVNVSDLASLLCVTKQSLGSMVRRLDSRGFLARERGDDRRNANIRLTVRGRSALTAAEELLHELPRTGQEAERTLRRHLEHHIRELRQYEEHNPFPQPPRSRPA
ncbi:MarR family transcriptional regulator [Arthrobacter sp. ISL-28]|uniref:MarR family winged helix-turn-helix transcriptional regulator n=1 Tax=Arthrobacter sp. ISL-28 TaxID=2819108 RepID=UPI001BE9FD8E|nr:MarR family transcriptional regulator [Arthrobacter sp. ISL-28]MBT2521147.1 MarR family transcriptional regulator [Arthrobacter sp. ISL-28]